MAIPHTLQWEIDRIPRNRKITHGPGVKNYSVDGIEPEAVVFPNTVEEVSSLLSAADRDGKAVVPWGGGTVVELGNRAFGCDLVISTSRLNRILEHEPADLTVVVETGITLGTLQEELRERGQFLPLDPPLPDRATIGGILSANSSGPMRAQFGAIRDRLIGIKVVNPNGDVTKGGGKVVKNVSGYDMNKVYTGALGTLGIIVEAAFKLAPLFKETRTILIGCRTAPEARVLVEGLSKAGVTPVALQLVGGNAFGVRNGFAVLLKVGGVREAVERQSRMAMELCESNEWPATDKGDEFWQILRDGESGYSISVGPDGESYWQLVCDAGRRSDSPATMIMKATCLPSDALSLLERMQRDSDQCASVSCNMVNGVVYGYWWDDGVSIDDQETRVKRVREITGKLNGHCVIEVCPRELKERIDVWGMDGPEVYLMKRIKEQFDPNGTLNPGRFVKGV